MRRAERNVTDPARIAEILNKCDCCRVGFWDGEEVYLVPMSFGWEKAGEKYTLWFHGAGEGRKAALARQCPRVSFEMDCGHGLRTAELACGFTTAYQCIMGTGRLAPAETAEDKQRGLDAVMAHYAPGQTWTFPQEMLERTNVYRLEAETLSCKVHS